MPQSGSYWVVESGDNLFSIATQRGWSQRMAAIISRLNGGISTLQPGQRLIMPRQEESNIVISDAEWANLSGGGAAPAAPGGASAASTIDPITGASGKKSAATPQNAGMNRAGVGNVPGARPAYGGDPVAGNVDPVAGGKVRVDPVVGRFDPVVGGTSGGVSSAAQRGGINRPGVVTKNKTPIARGQPVGQGAGQGKGQSGGQGSGLQGVFGAADGMKGAVSKGKETRLATPLGGAEGDARMRAAATTTAPPGTKNASRSNTTLVSYEDIVASLNAGETPAQISDAYVQMALAGTGINSVDFMAALGYTYDKRGGVFIYTGVVNKPVGSASGSGGYSAGGYSSGGGFTYYTPSGRVDTGSIAAGIINMRLATG